VSNGEEARGQNDGRRAHVDGLCVAE
jgi:hypothetical protein